LRLINVGVPEDEIAILTRTSQLASNFAMSFSDTQPALNWLTMHDAKGSEFQAVAVIGLDSQVLPDENRILAAKDEAQLDEVMSTERHLLYVGATRARDYLWISGSEPVSEFLMDLLTMKERKTR
ncbi:MAG: superfamily I DNA/RNA helicase, partial [Candidatus Azotimanducaceae bacterium]